MKNASPQEPDAKARDADLAQPPADFEGFHRSVSVQLARLFERHLDPGLYLVATPIGHLGDVTLRGLVTLAKASLVYCEDTRHSRKLLSPYGIKRALRSYHDFSDSNNREQILTAIEAGQSVALISDAGTPLIADPGYKLVTQAWDRGLSVFSIPGPSAVISALVSSGMPTDEFLFCGFLPAKDHAKTERLKNLENVPYTIVAYETAPRLLASLRLIQDIMPTRLLAVARELTKLNETILRGVAGELVERFDPKSLRGEIVLVISPAIRDVPTEGQILEELKHEMKTKSVSEAVEKVRKTLGAPKKMVYNLALREKSK